MCVSKTGYKTAGLGILQLSEDMKLNNPIQIEIQKCPLGKGTLEIQFAKLDLLQEKEFKKNEHYEYENSNLTNKNINNNKYINQSNTNNYVNDDYINQ